MVGRWTRRGGWSVAAIGAAVIALVGCGSPAAQAAQPTVNGAADPTSAATAALDRLATIWPDQLDQPVDFANATLGTPMPVKSVGLDTLRAYRAGDDPRALLVTFGDGTLCYPILVTGNSEAVVFVRRTDGGWHFARANRDGFEEPAVDAVYRELAATGMDGVALVEIPAVGYDFLASDNGAELVVTPLQDVPGTRLVAGTTLPATDAFSQLQLIATG